MENSKEDGLRFSQQALANRALFLSEFNEVNFFVEDVGMEYEYEEIFERLWGNDINIFTVFPLGGKSAVLKAHNTNGIKDENGRLNIYIVDGDFDNLWEDRKTISPNLIYLTRYNIESYFYSKEGVIKYLRSSLKRTRSEIDQKIQLSDWENDCREKISALFILFAVVTRYCPTFPNVQLGPQKFLDKQGFLLTDEYDQYRAEVIKNIGNITPMLEEVHQQISTSDNLFIICGKFLFDSLCRYLSFRCSKNINRTNFRSMLVSCFDIASLDFLKKQVFELMASELTP